MEEVGDSDVNHRQADTCICRLVGESLPGIASKRLPASLGNKLWQQQAGDALECVLHVRSVKDNTLTETAMHAVAQPCGHSRHDPCANTWTSGQLDNVRECRQSRRARMPHGMAAAAAASSSSQRSEVKAYATRVMALEASTFTDGQPALLYAVYIE